MSFAKWIGGWLGWINSQSFLGAIAGFVLGAAFDAFTERKSRQNVEFPGQDSISRDYGERNGFLFSLMVLSSHVIYADGKVMHSEMEFVRQFLRNSFGENAVMQGNDILLRLFEYRKQNGESAWNRQIQESCREMSRHMIVEHRIQLVAFLCEIAKADGHLDEREVEALRTIAINLSLNADLIEQMLHLGGDTIDDAYAVLGIAKDATDDEVRKAYRQMAIKHHPDRVATLGEDVKQAATRKFREINDAKERIYKSRGMK